MLLSYQVLWEDNNEGSIGFFISLNRHIKTNRATVEETPTDNSTSNMGDKMFPPPVEGVGYNHQKLRPNTMVHAGGKRGKPSSARPENRRTTK